MEKKTTPIITHTEILCLAIRQLEHEIDETRKKCEGIPGSEPLLQFTIKESAPKLEALRTLYKIETGTDYD